MAEHGHKTPHNVNVYVDGPAEHHEPEGSIFTRIIKPFIILFLLTAAEFYIALQIKTPENKFIIDIVFIVMTLVKAFYIVAYFMHLKFERIGLKWSILFPLLFIIYLLILLILEARYVFDVLWG